MKRKPGEKIRVLILETSMRVGGTETVITRLMERFNRDRIHPILCCIYEAGDLGKQLIKKGIDVRTNLAKGRWDFVFPFRLYRLLKQERIEVLFIVNQPVLQFWGTWCAILARVPVRITAIRSTGKINRIQRRLVINQMTFPWITRVTALSQMHKQYLIENERIDEKKIEIITNGVDLECFKSQVSVEGLRASLKIPDGAPIAGIVAMLRPEKAQHIFVRAAELILKQVPDAHFIIVGDGSEREGLENLARELKVDEHVHFLGSRSDISDLVNLFDVAVLSSNPVVETVSNSVLEYMAVNKPVVSTRVGSLPEMVDEGKTGFLVEPGDPKEMAEKIALLLQDRNLATRMGQAGREKIEKYYSIEQMVRNWEKLFERLLNQEKVSE